VVVDAIDDKAVNFYRKYGFTVMPTSLEQIRLLCRLKDIREDLGDLLQSQNGGRGEDGMRKRGEDS
jgi:hypothetical protein